MVDLFYSSYFCSSSEVLCDKNYRHRQVFMLRDTGTSSDNSSVPGRQVSSSGVDDYDYDYLYETTLDDEEMFDVDRLDIEYVDDLALVADELDPDMEFALDKTRHTTGGHRRRRPHARYIATVVYHCGSFRFACFRTKITRSV